MLFSEMFVDKALNPNRKQMLLLFVSKMFSIHYAKGIPVVMEVEFDS